MTNTLKQKQISLAVTCALALAFLSGTAQAQINPADTGYLGDSRGTIVRSNYGLCWHNGTGPAAKTPNECDSDGAVPAVKMAEPAKKPIVVAAVQAPVAKPAAQKVTLDADTLFDFDKAVLRPAGRTALDEFVVKTKDISPEVIVAVGHADRFGSEPYNQHLSEARAEAVKAYLMSKGIPANRLQTEGRGETQPVTKADECKGAKSAKVIACLQPDRRVVVEIVGTRTAM
ncbi:MAG: OmpA family protein [Sterolibacterium sp.]